MHYRPLGRTGIRVSPFAFGTINLATRANPDRASAIALLHRALDAGINLVDTADAYGDAEEVVGEALQGRRDDVVLASKFSRPMGEDPNRRGSSRRWIITAVEDSLRRLKTDYLDIYQAHRPDPATDIDETLSALSDLVHSGKVRTIGSSSFPASEIVEAQWASERGGFERFRVEQPTYSILSRTIEQEVLPATERYGMGVMVWGPLAQGTLTGRVRRGQETDLHRAAMFRHVADERRVDVVERLIPVAEEAGMPLTHLALGFVTAHPGVTSAIIGPRTAEQLDDLLAAADVRLGDDVLDRIDEIVPPGTEVGELDQAYRTPAILDASLRRRPLADRSAA